LGRRALGLTMPEIDDEIRSRGDAYATGRA
jgi:hypothetical protein